MTETQEHLLIYCLPPVTLSVGYVIFITVMSGGTADPGLVAMSALALLCIGFFGWSAALVMLWAFWMIGKGGAELIDYLVNRR